MFKIKPMRLAIDQAKLASSADEVPVGAVIIDHESAEVIAVAHNLVEEKSDPTAHAELLAIRMASEKLGSKNLEKCDIYVTLEPCPMCAQAISFSRLRRLYFGAYDPKGGGVDHGARIFNHSSSFHKPEVIGGIMEEECGLILKDFFKKKR